MRSAHLDDVVREQEDLGTQFSRDGDGVTFMDWRTYADNNSGVFKDE
jgi:hypothetical protein